MPWAPGGLSHSLRPGSTLAPRVGLSHLGISTSPCPPGPAAPHHLLPATRAHLRLAQIRLPASPGRPSSPWYRLLSPFPVRMEMAGEGKTHPPCGGGRKWPLMAERVGSRASWRHCCRVWVAWGRRVHGRRQPPQGHAQGRPAHRPEPLALCAQLLDPSALSKFTSKESARESRLQPLADDGVGSFN